MLGVYGIVGDGRIEPEAVALLAVIECSFQLPAAAGSTPPAAAPPPATTGLLVGVLFRFFFFLLLARVRRLNGVFLGLEGGGHEGVVLGAQVGLFDRARGAAVAVRLSG